MLHIGFEVQHNDRNIIQRSNRYLEAKLDILSLFVRYLFLYYTSDFSELRLETRSLDLVNEVGAVFLIGGLIKVRNQVQPLRCPQKLFL